MISTKILYLWGWSQKGRRVNFPFQDFLLLLWLHFLEKVHCIPEYGLSAKYCAYLNSENRRNSWFFFIFLWQMLFHLMLFIKSKSIFSTPLLYLFVCQMLPMEHPLVKVAAHVTWCSFRMNMCFLCIMYKKKMTAQLVSESWAQSPFLARLLGYYWASYVRLDPQNASKAPKISGWDGNTGPNYLCSLSYTSEESSSFV